MFDDATILVRQVSERLAELELVGEVNVFLASRLHEEALRLADQGCEVVVVAERLTGLDAAVLQILVALKMALNRRGCGVQFRGLSAALLETLRMAGLESRLHDAPTAAAVSEPALS